MTTDTPSTSGEGVDILDTISRGALLAYQFGHNHEEKDFHLARQKIAELIEAAEAYLHSDKEPMTAHMVLGGELAEIEVGSAEENRLKAAIAACRATQGAHR